MMNSEDIDTVENYAKLIVHLSPSERATLEEQMTTLIKAMKDHEETIMTDLQSTIEVDDKVMEFLKLIHAMDYLREQIELSLEVVRSESDGEIEEIKKRYPLVQREFGELKSKDDFTFVPLKFALKYMLEKVFPELDRAVENCFKKKRRDPDDMKFIKSPENIARIQIIAFKFEIFGMYYHKASMCSKQDIFSYEKSSPLWQDLQKSVTFKQILTKQEIKNTLKLFYLFFTVGAAILKQRAEGQPAPPIKSAFHLLRDILYYGTQHAKAETQALLYFLNPSIEHAFKTWDLPEHEFVAKVANLRCPRMGFDKVIYLPKLFPQITKELVLSEYEDGTINKITPMDPALLAGLDLKSIRSNVVKYLSVNEPNKVAVRVLSLKKLDFEDISKNSAKQNDAVANPLEEVIIIHMHGGGFVSMSSCSHRCYSTRWVKNMKVTLFSIDYRLAPKHPYPEALDDCWQAYLWITKYAEDILGIKHAKIILAGDSAGGNLVLALTLRLIKCGLKPPSGCFLTYPALLLDDSNCSPSYYNSLEDPVLHYSILKLCLNAYVPKEYDPLKDPFVSPLVATDEFLAKLPPIRIVTGSEDPLHDDNWRFLYRLRKLNKDVKMIVHRDLSHAFLCYQDLKRYDEYIKEACEMMTEMAMKEDQS